MGLKIKANSFAMNRWLEVVPHGVVFCETAAFGGKREFEFREIECVLISSEGVLSFQVGNEIFSLPVKQEKHREVIDALLNGVRQSDY